MWTRRYAAERLADALVVGPLSADRIVERMGALLGHRKEWVSRLAESLSAEFSNCVRPRNKAVAEAILGSDTFRKAWTKERDQLRVHLEVSASMLPVEPLKNSGVPAILNPRELAGWLDTPLTRLMWLADEAYRERDQEREPLRHYVYSWRQKKRGSQRLIESPKRHLKWIQRSILRGILNCIRPHEAAHGFCPGRSLHTFAEPHLAQSFVLAIDLEAFFASVAIPRVRALFRAIGYPDEVASMLAALSTNVPPQTTWKCLPGGMNASERFLYDRPHLPQGAPTSPALANLCAYRLDCRLAGLASWAEARYSRYADDLVFSGGDVFRRRAERVHIYAATIALEEGFRVNHRKTRRLPRSVRQEIAGVVVNERPNLRRAGL